MSTSGRKTDTDFHPGRSALTGLLACRGKLQSFSLPVLIAASLLLAIFIGTDQPPNSDITINKPIARQPASPVSAQEEHSKLPTATSQSDINENSIVLDHGKAFPPLRIGESLEKHSQAPGNAKRPVTFVKVTPPRKGHSQTATSRSRPPSLAQLIRDHHVAGDRLSSETMESRLHEMLHSYPSAAILHAELGTLLAQRGDWPEATQAFKAAIAYEPGNPTYHQALAACHENLRQPMEAAAHYRWAHDLLGGNASSLESTTIEIRLRELGYTGGAT